MKLNQLKLNRWLIILTFLVVVVLMFFIRWKMDEYSTVFETYETRINDLKFTRYYLVTNYCLEKGFNSGFIPISGLKEDSLLVVCMSCSSDGRCHNITTEILK